MDYQLVKQDSLYELVKRDENGRPFEQGKQYTVRSLCSRLEQLKAEDNVDFTQACFREEELAKVMKAYDKRLPKPAAKRK